jgi:hypothetical protein
MKSNKIGDDELIILLKERKETREIYDENEKRNNYIEISTYERNKKQKRRKMEYSVTNIDLPTSIMVLHDSLNYILIFRVTFKKFKIINMMSFLIIYSLLLKIRFFGIGGDSPPPQPPFLFLFLFLIRGGFPPNPPFLFSFSLSFFSFFFLFLFCLSFFSFFFLFLISISYFYFFFLFLF